MLVMVCGALSALSFTSATAQDRITAGSLAENMTNAERGAYLAGIIEGLAYARFALGDSDSDAMACVYEWYFDPESDAAHRKIFAAFERYPDYPPAALINALLKDPCGG